MAERNKKRIIEKKGGYPAGERPVAQMPPPPAGPGPGSRPAPQTPAKPEK